MADEGDTGDKTEAPTGRRLGDARSRGQVGQSSELSSVLGMIAAFHALSYIAPALWQSIITLVKMCFSLDVAKQNWTPSGLEAQFIALILMILPNLLYILLIAALFGAGCTLAQTKLLWSWSLLKPKFHMLNPVTGIKRIFSMTNSINLLKQIAKLCIIGPIAYGAYFALIPQFLGVMYVPIDQLLPLTAQMASGVFTSIMKLLVGLAILDLIYQRYKHSKMMKMSKTEVKDERKSSEGDETIKRKILAMGLQRARQRMMNDVPKADVVVTNPTHYAVALSYSQTPGTAPKVVAKGQGHVALRIREIAQRHNVPVIERKPLARALFASVEVGQEIPYDLFKAVAEVLAYVYRLKGKTPLRRKGTPVTKQPLNQQVPRR